METAQQFNTYIISARDYMHTYTWKELSRNKKNRLRNYPIIVKRNSKRISQRRGGYKGLEYASKLPTGILQDNLYIGRTSVLREEKNQGNIEFKI